MRIGRKRGGKREEDYGNADKEEECERDEEMRGRAADSGISRKVSAVSRCRVLGTDRFLERTATKELRIDGAKSLWILLQITLRTRNEKKRVGMSTSPNFFPSDVKSNMQKN